MTLAPAPPRSWGDTGTFEDFAHYDTGNSGAGVDLSDFGRLLHNRDYVQLCSVRQCSNAASATPLVVPRRRMDELRAAALDFFRRGLEKTGWTPYRWGREAGVSPTTITRPLNNPDWKTIPKLATLIKLAEVADVDLPTILRQSVTVDLTQIERSIPVVGEVRAGSWERIPDDPNIVEWLPMEVPEYAGADLFALRVVGRSMDLIYPDGTYVVCIPPSQSGFREGDCVVVRQWDGDRAETTLKQIERLADGSYVLQPRSSDPELQTPIAVPRRNHDAQSGVDVIGVVVVEYRKERRGRGPLITF